MFHIDPNERSKTENLMFPRTEEEHAQFVHGLEVFNKDWVRVAELIPTRTITQVRTHAQKYFLALQKQTSKNARSGMRTARKMRLKRPNPAQDAEGARETSSSASMTLPLPAGDKRSRSSSELDDMGPGKRSRGSRESNRAREGALSTSSAEDTDAWTGLGHGGSSGVASSPSGMVSSSAGPWAAGKGGREFVRRFPASLSVSIEATRHPEARELAAARAQDTASRTGLLLELATSPLGPSDPMHRTGFPTAAPHSESTMFFSRAHEGREEDTDNHRHTSHPSAAAAASSDSEEWWSNDDEASHPPRHPFYSL